jgi:acyl-coenzyme A thioesterase PaaI-like protein
VQSEAVVSEAVQSEAVVSGIVASYELDPSNFIYRLGMEHAFDGEGLPTVSVTLGQHRCDVGLAATLVDIVGGRAVMQRRSASVFATTHIELHGIDVLVGPGRLTATARVLSMSKRRCLIEIVLKTSTASAIGHVGFAIRDLPPAASSLMSGSPSSSSPASAMTAPAGIMIEVPVWEMIGVALPSPGHSSITPDPSVANHLQALQGGATAALIEAAACGAVAEPGRILDASINYLAQARGDSIEAIVSHTSGGVFVVDVFARPEEAPIARAVLRQGDEQCQ